MGLSLLRYSRRFPWSSERNRLWRRLEEKRRAGDPLWDLTESNPTNAGLEYPPQVLAALSDPRALRYEPAPAGLPAAREAVAAYYRERGHDVQPARILLTASTSESYSFLFKLLCDPGDEILVPRPSYPLFEYLASLDCVTVRQYPLECGGGWPIDFSRLEPCIQSSTRAIVLVNPNNPTGSFLKRQELDRLLELCRRYGLALISDEVFRDYSFRADAGRVESLVDVADVPCFCLSGLSKVSALPQMKLGWIVANSPQALERLELIADHYLSVGAPVQHALPTMLAAAKPLQKQIRERLDSNLQFLESQLPPELRLLPAEGGWNAIVEVPRVRSEEQWALLALDRASVMVQPGFFYDFEREAFLVLSLLTPEEVFRAGVRRLVEAIKEALP